MDHVLAGPSDHREIPGLAVEKGKVEVGDEFARPRIGRCWGNIARENKPRDEGEDQEKSAFHGRSIAAPSFFVDPDMRPGSFAACSFSVSTGSRICSPAN
jgi:hypothetical protein